MSFIALLYNVECREDILLPVRHVVNYYIIAEH